MWHVNSFYLLIFREWIIILLFKNLSLTRLISGFKQPTHFARMKVSNVEKIASLARTLIKVDHNEEDIFMTRNYLRFRVKIDVNKPLTARYKIPKRSC